MDIFILFPKQLYPYPYKIHTLFMEKNELLTLEQVNRNTYFKKLTVIMTKTMIIYVERPPRQPNGNI